MMIHRIGTALLGLSIALVPVCQGQAKREPSTPAERQQMLELVHAWQADPLGPQAKDEFGQVLKWFSEVPDLTVNVCTILEKLPKGDKKDAATVFGGQFMAQAAFVLENAGKEQDKAGEYLAGIEGALRTYEWLVKKNAKDQQAYLDDLIQRRNSGTLVQFVRERAATECK